MEPVRVKLYGLFSYTKRRYWIQTLAVELPAAVVMLAGWYFALRPLCERLSRADLPPSAYRSVVVAFLSNLPWIVLAAVACKAVEAWIVLRIFARKEAQAKKAGERGA